MKSSNKVIGLKNILQIPTLAEQRKLREVLDGVVSIEQDTKSCVLVLPMYSASGDMKTICELVDGLSGDCLISCPIGFLRDIWSEYDSRIEFYVHSDVVFALLRE